MFESELILWTQGVKQSHLHNLYIKRAQLGILLTKIHQCQNHVNEELDEGGGLQLVQQRQVF